MVGHALMNYADKVGLAVVVHGQREIAGSIGLGMCGRFHAVGQLDENDFIPGGRFVGGAVGDFSGERLRRGQTATQSAGQNEEQKRF